MNSTPLLQLRSLLTTLVILSSFAQSFSQSRKIDSLRSVIKTPPRDTADVKTMVTLSMALFHGGNFDTSLHLAIQARKLAEDLHFKKGVASALLSSGYAYKLKGAYEASLKDLKEGLVLYEELNDNLNTGRALNFIAQVYNATGERDKALSYLQRASEFVEKAGHKEGLSVIYIDLGINHFDRGSYEVALEYYLLSLRLSESVKAYSKMAMAMNNIGVVYEAMNEKEKALEYYEECLALTESHDIVSKRALALLNTGKLYALKKSTQEKGEKYLSEGLSIVRENGDKKYEIYALSGFGDYYKTKGNLAKAEEFFKQAVDIGREINSPEATIGCLKEIGALALLSGKFDRAQKFASESLSMAERLDSKASRKEIYLFQSQLDSARGDFRGAFVWYKRYAQLNDSLFNERKTAKILHLQTLYDKEKQENEAKAELTALHESSGTAGNYQLTIVIILSVLFFLSTLTLGWLLFKRVRNRDQSLSEATH
jgi:tetratricopeptide (TPR) repeat protein